MAGGLEPELARLVSREFTGSITDISLLDRILAGRDQPFFCSQFVVYVYQWAAEQSGMSPPAIFTNA